VDFASVDESLDDRAAKLMALFTKDADKNVKNETAAKLTSEPQAQPVPVTQTAAPANMAPEEKPATSMGSASTEIRSYAERRAYLDSGSKISGKLLFEGTTRIDGQVDGEIIVKESLVIGESAVVSAQIKADSIIVAGSASGDLIASQRLEIRSSARVTGNLTSPVVIVHEGATFQGHCSMQPEGAGADRKVAAFTKHEWLPQVAQKEA
jgi:cytoskeletal protein CcmA (bactofilin family)